MEVIEIDITKVKGVASLHQNREKWKYILKIALLFSFVQANIFQIIKVIFGEFTTNFETPVQLVFGWALGNIAVTIFIYPIGIFWGLYLWKNSKKRRLSEA